MQKNPFQATNTFYQIKDIGDPRKYAKDSIVYCASKNQ
jgi:hypothetical protein